MTARPTLEADLAEALSTRAAAVTATPTTTARAAVDRRLARRRRRRRARGAAVGALVAALALLSPLGVIGAGRSSTDGPADVVAGPGLDPADDPVTSGLPRLALDPPAGLRLRVEADPLVAPEARPHGSDALAAVERLRVVRRAGALVPAVFLPGAVPAGERATAGTALSVGPGDAGGAGGVWTGRAAGWDEYDAGLADPARRPAYGFGVDAGTLADVSAGAVPPGFVVHEVSADPADPADPADQADPAVGPAYRLRYDGEGVVAGLRVWAESDLHREAELLRVLAGAEEAGAVEVGGRPGVLARHPGGPWSVGWSPAEGVTAALIVAGDGLDRPQVEAIAAAVRTVDADEWATLVAEGRS